ncbi:hypothetical protein K431DRAFT_233629 [Polychaeton citri CBS 116435]|uniref:D-serine dehydratase n=1 Tax=Polychaeton citri CBS 116435 TaxID=1314669 RepID=A0A9P4Q0G9_9PEZI|nr:hypothetical protein K431DRAFT_233629 [Polychaeton citri CBS 116435]
MALTSPAQYPTPSEATLKLQFVGKQIKDVQAPAVIIDAAVVRRNCKLMLDTTEKLGLGFRAHVKTHKTIQLSKFQVGHTSKSMKLVASTVAEIENLMPWLLESKLEGKSVNVLFGLPVSPSSIPRLANVARILGDGSVGVFVDHPTHVKLLDAVPAEAWPGKIPAWINIDVGYHREGVAPESKQLADLGYAFAAANRVHVAGIYTHLGSSYAVSSPEEALKDLSSELRGLEDGAVSFLKCAGAEVAAPSSGSEKITLSLGATPTATAAQNILHQNTELTREYKELLEKVNKSFAVEIHAGVYPLMDMQQLATRARPQKSSNDEGTSLLDFQTLGLRTLVEVNSLYPDRSDKQEAMVAGGSIVLGREPCKSYPGWGVVTPWPAKLGESQIYDPEGSRTGWIVGKVSQEHGNLVWEGPAEKFRKLEIGQKLLVWPNHACIAGAGFGWYLVVDSDQKDPDQIIDVWVRFRGW